MRLSKYIFTAFIAIVFQLTGHTQDSSLVYYDAYWNEVSDSLPYAYYRVEKRQHSFIQVTNYYRDGTLRMQGTRSPFHQEDHWEQALTFYDTNGNISHRYHYLNNKKNGKAYTYFSSGSIKRISEYSDDLKTGTDSTFNAEGTLLSTIPYRMDKKHGNAYSWHGNGTLSAREIFVNDMKNDTQLYYFESGLLRRKEVYSDSIRISGSCYDTSGSVIPFFEREVLPEFNGNFNRFLMEQLIYPADAAENSCEGKVMVYFEVTRSGAVTNVEVRQKIHPSLAKEAKRVINKSSGKWIPGKLEGVESDFRFTQPVVFRLQ